MGARVSSWEGRATAAQLAELQALAKVLDEDVPEGLKAHEAAQKLDEFRRRVIPRNVDVAHLHGQARHVDVIVSSLL